MLNHLSVILLSIPQQPQRQDSTNAQIADLCAFGSRVGLFEAVKAIKVDYPEGVEMPDRLKAILDSICYQAALNLPEKDQLFDLLVFANRLGLYDAADIVRTTLGVR